jgi:hypothetical protein
MGSLDEIVSVLGNKTSDGTVPGGLFEQVIGMI